jgi:hypothetical protein
MVFVQPDFARSPGHTSDERDEQDDQREITKL